MQTATGRTLQGKHAFALRHVLLLLAFLGLFTARWLGLGGYLQDSVFLAAVVPGGWLCLAAAANERLRRTK